MHGVVLDASAVRAWCRCAADDLSRARAALDELNVFPVADADTGTNLHLTLVAAAGAPGALRGTAQATWAAMARAAMLGAHGNSGVILSQLLRGLAERAPADGPALAAALRHAADVAYAAVGNPVDGTMLTVADAAAASAESAASATAAADGDLAAIAAAAADGAWQALQRTPEQLAALAEAGVVDAGAAGLVIVLDALARVCAGAGDQVGSPRVPRPRAGAPTVAGQVPGPAYEVMYLLDAASDAVAELRDTLAGLGDSLVVVGGDGLWNVHVHVDDAGAAVDAGLAVGRPHRVRITHLHVPGAAADPTGKPCRKVVATAPTADLGALYEAGGAVCVVRDAAQTAPNVDAVCQAVSSAAATEVVLLSDDATTFAVVTDAVTRLRAGGLRAAVVPARAVVQSLAALAVHQPERPFDEDLVAMTAAAVATRYGEVQTAEPAAERRAIADVTRLLRAGPGELVTLVHGQDVPTQLLDAVTGHLSRHAPEVETVVYPGGSAATVLQIGVE